MSKPRRYLVVDDNAQHAENLAEILSQEGHEVVALSDPRKALERLEGPPFDALITDLQMPDLSGAQLIQRVHAIDPGLPVVLLTAFGNHEALSAARREGLVGVLPKPLPILRLLEMLKGARRDSTVLVIEDDATVREYLCEAINDRGLSVVPVGDMNELASVLTNLQPFAALVDLIIPGGVLGDAYREVTRKLAGTPALVITGYAGLWEAEGAEVIRKPIDTHALIDRLEQLYRRSRPS